MPQQQIQKTKPVRKPASESADAPTVNAKIARLWFRENS
jgi:hypothetical protein